MTVQLGLRLEEVPDFPDSWVVAGSKEAAGLVVWLNGNNVSDRCLAFEKLYTSNTAYWGTICLIVTTGPIGGTEPGQLPRAAPMVYIFRKGIILWDNVMEMSNEN